MGTIIHYITAKYFSGSSYQAPPYHKSLQQEYSYLPDVVTYTRDSSTQEARTGRSLWVQGQHGLHREFRASLSYIAITCLEKTKKWKIRHNMQEEFVLWFHLFPFYSFQNQQYFRQGLLCSLVRQWTVKTNLERSCHVSKNNTWLWITKVWWLFGSAE